MADNIALPGAGSAIATDEISGIHFQRMKLTVGEDGTADDLIPTTPGNGDLALLVESRRTSEHENITPTLSTSPAYAAGDAMGVLEEAVGSYTTDSRVANLRVLTIVDKTSTKPDLDIIFTGHSGFPSGTDNAAFGPSDTDLNNRPFHVVKIRTADWVDFANNSAATVALDVMLPLVSFGGIWRQVITRSSFTAATAGDLQMQLSWIAS